MAKSKAKATTAASRTSASIVENLGMLRSFVANDAFSETDLSTCLRQAGYNVELAAERLMTGQFQPRKRQKVQIQSTPPNTAMTTMTTATTTMTMTHLMTPRASRTGSVATNTRKPRPVTPKTPSPSSASMAVRSSTKHHPTIHSSAAAGTSAKSGTARSSSSFDKDSSWLLCHRWISDGICLQRNGGMAYQESLQVEHSVATTFPKAPSTTTTTTMATTTTTVRFRGHKILGQFPKHLSPMLGPLLEAELIQVEAQALMEERCLPTGADVAFAVWIYLPDPLKFLALLDPATETADPTKSSKFFFAKAATKNKNNNNNMTGRSMLQQAAMGLLQWAQHGETFHFETMTTTNAATSTGSNSTKNNDNGEEEVFMDETENYNPEEAENDADNSELAKDLSKAVIVSAPLQEMEAPTDGSFKASLRPYQRQALWWMTQREAQMESEESSRQQLELLEELLQSTSLSSSSSSSSSSSCHSSTTSSPPKSSIHCECGPVRVDTSNNPAPPIMDVLHPSPTMAHPDLKHPLWERRYLTNASKTKAASFYVQPIFGAAVASPPPPPRPCRGGILADSMGLGKTVMLLALIQSSVDAACRKDPNTTTLIVSPLSLLAQWQEEIKSKTSLTYHVYYGDKKQNALDFDNVDVVLTTYGSLQGEWVSHSKATNEFPVVTGLLGHTWKRVILDEAHCVKNTATVASRACCMLQAERRWCVSGTIIQNSLEDVYALLKFLRHEPWCQPSFWKAAVSSKLRSNAEDHLEQKQEALDRVKRLLPPIMLRRTKDSVDKDGNPILTLPPVDTKIIPVEFTPAERQFYDALHRKSQSLFEGFIRAGTASKSWLAIFSLLHRLRQTCDHVALTIKSHIDEEEWASNISQSKEDEDSNARSILTNTKESIDKKFLDDLLGKFRAMQSSSGKGKYESSQESEDAPYAAKIAQMLTEAVQSKSSLLKEECSICLDPINLNDSVVTPCFHIFCKDCLVGVLCQQSSNQNSDSNKPVAMVRLHNGPCPVCTEPIDVSKILRFSETEGNIQTSYLLKSMVLPKMAAKRQGDGVARQTLETAVQGSTSSKLTAILEELDNVWNEDPGSKVLIFSQFLGFLDLMEESFKNSQIPFARLDGKLNLKERTAILQEFGSDRGERQRISVSAANRNVGSVLLISMKAGGVGLNLVSARTVFIADRWWNASVEDQCVDRIHRIGQTADKVRVRKFYVANSVEERIVELQKRKKNVASQVLCDQENGNSNDQNGSRPTLDDFKILFQE